MSRTGISAMHRRFYSNHVTAAALVFLLGLLALRGVAAQSSPSGGASASAGKEQQGWIEKQFQRFRSFPHLDRAYQLMKENKPGEARVELERYLSLSPADRIARTNYLQLLYQMKDYSSSIREAERLLQEKPEGKLYLYRAMAREKMQDSARALDDYRQAIVAPDAEAADKTLALDQATDLAIALKKPDVALEFLDALGRTADPYRANLRRGMALEMLNQLQAAVKAYALAARAAKSTDDSARALRFEGEARKKAGEWKSAREAFERYLASHPNELAILRALGEVTFKEKLYEDAIRYTRQALLLQENRADRELLVYALRESGDPAGAEKELDVLLNKAGGVIPDARLYVLQSELALAQNNVETAKLALKSALQRDPANPQALRLMARIAGDRKRTRESIRWMEQIPLGQRQPEDREFLASLYLADGRPQPAIFLYCSLLESGYRKESRHTLLFQLGGALNASKRYAEAARILAEASALQRDVPTVEALTNSLVKSGKARQATTEIDRLVQKTLSPEERTKTGILYIQTGEDKKALRELSVALRGTLSTESERRACTQRGFIHRRAGNLPEARDDFEAALRSGAQEADVYLALGETYIALKDFDRAKDCIEEAQRRRVKSETRMLLAQAYEGSGNLADALSLYQALLLESKPDSGQALTLLAAMGNLEARMGQPGAAARHFLQAYEKSEAANWKLLYQAMQSSVAAQQWDEADGACARLLTLPSLPPDTAAETWEQRANISLKLHKPEQAVECFKNAIAGGRDGWELHEALGLVLYDLGRREQALQSFLASLQRSEAARTLAHAGRCYKEMGKQDMAVQFFQKSLANPNGLASIEKCEIQKEVGYLYFGASDYTAAAAAWANSLRCQSDPILAVRLSKTLRLAGRMEKAQESLPQHPSEAGTPAVQAEYFDELAQQVKSKAQPREAITALLKAQQLDPQPLRDFQLGQWYREINDTDHALLHFNRAIAQDGSNAVYRSALGYALLAEKRYKEAAVQLEEDVRTEPDSMNLYKDLGYVHMHLSRNEEAAKDFSQAIRNEPLYPIRSPEDANVVRKDLGRMRQEVAKLNNRLDLTMYLAQSSDKRDLPPAPPALALGVIPSSAGAELDYTPPTIGFRDERLFQVFGRVLGNLRPGSLDPDPDSYQAGVGARYKPLRSQNLFFSGEKIFGLRNSGANNWLLRGLYSRDWGYDVRPGCGRWNYTLFYGDLGLFMKEPRYLIGYSEFRQGISFNLSDTLVITPHLIVDGRLYRLQRVAEPYLEGGGGVSFKFYLHHGEHRLRRATLEFLLHYRMGQTFTSAPVLGEREFKGFAGTAVLSF